MKTPSLKSIRLTNYSIIRELKRERSGKRFKDVDSLIKVIKRVMYLYDSCNKRSDKRSKDSRYNITRLRFISSVLDEIFLNCYNDMRIYQGHFYVSYTFRSMGIVIKVLKDSKRRLDERRGDEKYLREYYNIKHGVATFPSKSDVYSKHFAYPIWRSVGNIVYIQDLVKVDRDSTGIAMCFFGLMQFNNKANDIHDGNVGLLGDEPVIFDWWHK